MAKVYETADNPMSYQIHAGWYEARDRSLDGVLASRRCGSHAATAGGSGRRRALPDPATGELRFVEETANEDPFEAIARCCATQADFITPLLPLREAIFRVFLAKANQPLTAEEIHDELRAWFASSSRSRYFTVETIARLLEYDTSYGIAPAADVPAGR